MLTGRESLLRVMGKRRRYLPNRHSILAAFSSTLEKDENAQRHSVEKGADGGGDAAEWVNCPVCGARFPSSDNSLINFHLDECLAKGNKRKLSQLTLLELNFSRSKVTIHSSGSDDNGNRAIPSEPNRISTFRSNNYLSELDGPEEYDDRYRSTSLRNNPFASCVEKLVEKDIANDKSASQPLHSEIERPKYALEECLDDYDISKVFIPTFIVGHRYSSREELDPESRICLSRDPKNIKDPNAIQVLYADCESNSMLGYIPRELAQYLSPLIDKFHLRFEGSITSLPKDSRAAVPIQIFCSNVQSCDQISCHNVQDFKSLWRHVLRVVEVGKTNLSGTTRYQHNLVLLMQDVLRSHPHLFSMTEISFLEAFKSLPDDSQRLFARFYTRKGPWFRMSSISYPEIADYHKAIKDLLEAGYLCSFLWRNKLENNDLEEVLNILNMDELREALHVLNKVACSDLRMHLINDLFKKKSRYHIF